MPWHIRRWCVTDLACPEELAVLLTDQVWCGCAGFRFGGYLWLNDATGPDGAQEYVVLREADLAQVESITFSWMDAVRASWVIRQIVSGEVSDHSRTNGMIERDVIETPAQHGRCPRCA